MAALRKMSKHPLPTTIVAADGGTQLDRFLVTAVIYAPSASDAAERLHQASIYLDAGQIVV